jgi:hypothetical protein
MRGNLSLNLRRRVLITTDKRRNEELCMSWIESAAPLLSSAEEAVRCCTPTSGFNETESVWSNLNKTMAQFFQISELLDIFRPNQIGGGSLGMRRNGV